MSVPFRNVGGDLSGGRPGHLRDPDGVGEVGRPGDADVPRVKAGQVMGAQGAVIRGGHPEREAGHGRSIAA
ncbi:hypothetical protein [Micromonospora haikouensis]|uniref:hypothetical protein n=1 Tax=Micromonospora haikouensis TaxID=686309 RepID=UPI0037A3CF6A